MIDDKYPYCMRHGSFTAYLIPLWVGKSKVGVKTQDGVSESANVPNDGLELLAQCAATPSQCGPCHFALPLRNLIPPTGKVPEHL